MHENQKLQDIFNLCARHDDGRALLSFLLEKNVPVISDESVPYAVTAMYFFIREKKLLVNTDKLFITLQESKDAPTLAECLLHEARHVQQAFGGAATPGMRVSPDDYAWFIRVTEADAEATAALIAFKMKVAGFPEVFDAAKKEFPHCAKIYETAEREYERNPGSLDTPAFKRKLFDAWFLTNDKSRYDTQCIQRFAEIDDFCAKLPKRDSPRTAVEKIGTCGGEPVNYLTLDGFRPLDDPYYKDIRIENPMVCLHRDSLMMTWKMAP